MDDGTARALGGWDVGGHPALAARGGAVIRTVAVVGAVLAAGMPDAWGHPADGQWRLAIPEAEAEARLSDAIETALLELPWLFRGLARSKIRAVTAVCVTYAFDVDEDELFVRCNDGGGLRRPRTGDVAVTGRDGNTATSRVRVGEDRLEFDWLGDSGGLFEVVSADGATMAVRSTISADKLPEPIVWTLPYERVTETVTP